MSTDSPVAQFRFSDAAGSGTVADSVGTFSATNTGITLGGEGPFGGSKSGLFGTESFATLPSSPLSSATEFSAEAWVNWAGGSSFKQPIFDFGSSSSNYMYLTPASALTGNTMLFEIHTTAGTVAKVTATKLTEKAWKYVAVTETSTGTLILYVNGVEVGKSTGATISPSSLGSSPTDYLGKSLVTADPKFKGSLSNVAFYKRALSATRILAHYNAAEYPVNTAVPTITGTAKEGETLKAKEGTWSGVTPFTYTYQWQRCNASSECSNIASATSAEYKAKAEDVGLTLRVVVTAKNSAGTGEANSAKTATVAAVPPTNKEKPIITGSAKVGQLLTVSNGVWNGTPATKYTYKWESCGGTCKAISGATASSYRITSAQLGEKLQAVVTDENPAGSASATSLATATVTTGPPVNVALPAITGKAEERQTLTASAGTWAGTEPITYTYQWQLCNNKGESCTSISGGTKSTYVPVESSLGSTVRVEVLAKNSVSSAAAFSAATAVIVGSAPENTALPTVAGEARDGQTFTAGHGTWVGTAPVTYHYQWQSCSSLGGSCVSIAGATSATYVLGHGDVGSTVRVNVEASNGIGSTHATSAATATVALLVPEGVTPPTISGTAQENQTLVASTGTWNGTPPISYGYRWEICNATGGECAEMPTTFSRRYTIPAADVGSTLRVVVTGDNNAGSNPQTSAATAVISPGTLPANTVAPTISGFAQEGQPLIATVGTWSGTQPLSYGYQWERCNTSGGECSNITAATSRSYSSVHADVAATLRVVVTATNVAGSTPATSAATATITAPTLPANTTLPAVSGSGQQGQTLTTSSGAWSGTAATYSYQWERCNTSGGACVNITGATVRSYVLASADVGSTLRVIVTATNAAGSTPATSAATATITAATAPANTSLPAISGAAKDGQTLLASNGSWSGTAASYSYQWQSCNNKGQECANAAEAAGQSYVLSSGDLESTVRVIVTASNAAGTAKATSAASATVEPGGPSELEAPSISGNPWAGETLHASGGVWRGTEIALSYQWQSCSPTGGECASIAGATSSEYTLGEGDIETTVRVRIGAGDAQASVTALTPVTQLIGAETTLRNTLAPSITENPMTGKTLTVNAGSWLGTPPVSNAYQWQSCNRYGTGCKNIEGATGANYLLSSADTGNTLRSLVTVSEAAGVASEATPASALVVPEYAPVLQEAATISGTGLVGYTLAANVGAWSGEAPISYAYQWQRCNEGGESCTPISGATASTYTLTTSDIASTLRILVSATDIGGTSETLSNTIAVSSSTLTELAAPSISGIPQLGETLTASPGIWTAPATIGYTYQWERCNYVGLSCSTIAGATASTYTAGEADAGRTLKVTVTVTSAAGNSSGTSVATGVVASEPTAPSNTAAPTIEGAPTSGTTLSASPGTWLGTEPISYTYQWQSCTAEGESCTNISGATSQTYLLVTGNNGSTIRVIVTATNSVGSETAASTQTETVGPPGPPVASERPSIQGTAKQGQTLYAGNGAWTGSRPLKYFYRWERCNTLGETCATIAGATKPTYVVATADVGSTLRISVTATNTLGGASSISLPTAVAISATEASVSQAIEIAEATDPSVLATATSGTVEGEATKPAAEDAGEALTASSTLTNSSVSKETSGEFSVNTPSGELSITPLNTAPNGTATPTIVNGASAVFAGTQTATDTIVRPEPLGATTLLQLRSNAAPTTFSWQIGLGANQELKPLPNGSVAVTEPTSGSSLEGTLTEAGLETPEHEAPAETSGEEGYNGETAEKELESGMPTEGPLEALPAAPTTSTSPNTPKSGELHPQESQAQGESAASAMSYAEGQTANATLMVIQVPQVLDSAGNAVPASLSVEGNTVTLTLTPGSATYPVTAALGVGAPSNAASITRAPSAHYGLSDQNAEPFVHSEENGAPVEHLDKHLTTGPLHITSGRLIINYNTPPSSPLLKEWLEAVGKAGLKPFITLRACEGQPPSYKESNSRVPCPKNAIPSRGTYYNDAKALMRKFIPGNPGAGIPPVRIWGAWNEPDLVSNPLHRSSVTAAYLWGEAQRASEAAGCHHHCLVVAGEFAGYLPHHGYVANYESTILNSERHHQFPVTTKPRVWGLHDYNDLVNIKGEAGPHGQVISKHFANREAQEFVLHTKTKRLGNPHDWLTEQGVKLVENAVGKSGATRLNGNNELQRLAAQDFLRLGKPSERVEWAYYYLYRGPSKERVEELAAKSRPQSEFDSGLLAGAGYGTEPLDWRPAYCVIALGLEGCPPKTETQAPIQSAITPSSAPVAMTVNPEGEAAKYFVQYGISTSYGQTTTTGTTANATGNQIETANLSSLTACTGYHYESEAENAANEGKPSTGGDQTTHTTGCVAEHVDAGGEATCALTPSTQDSQVACWGAEEGGPENGLLKETTLPVFVSGLTSATALTRGSYAECALLASGGIDCWGENESDQLGDGEAGGHSATPRAVSGITTATQVSAGTFHTCARLSSGGVDCWGSNEDGALGSTSILNGEPNPVPVGGISNAVEVQAGHKATCALISGGTIKCWGDGTSGMLGNGKNEAIATPQAVGGITNATEIAMGSADHVCALLATGGVDCWGGNEYGQLGDGNTTNINGPVAVSGISTAIAITAGWQDTCALLSGGTVKCWGDDKAGMLGNGEESETPHTTPVTVSGITNATAISAGDFHVCARLSSGQLKCWGQNYRGQLGNGHRTADFTSPGQTTPGIVTDFE